jgi:hypothetical protein
MGLPWSERPITLFVSWVEDRVAVEVSGIKVADTVAAGEREGAGSSVGVADARTGVGVGLNACKVGLAVLPGARTWPAVAVATITSGGGIPIVAVGEAIGVVSCCATGDACPNVQPAAIIARMGNSKQKAIIRQRRLAAEGSSLIFMNTTRRN